METRHIQGNIRGVDTDNRTVTFTASTATKDRHGTVLNQANWNLENFNRNGIIGYNHEVYGGLFNSSDPDDIIGTGRAYVENGDLLLDVRFEDGSNNPKAEKIYNKVQNGILKAVSVGFMPIGKGKYGEGAEARGGENETYYFEGQELLEVSIVNIPSNPDAVKRYLPEQIENMRKIVDDYDSNNNDVQPDIEEDYNEGKIQLKRKQILLAEL